MKIPIKYINSFILFQSMKMDQIWKPPQPLADESKITKEWLQEMLSAKYQVKTQVHNWVCTPPTEREGFLSEIRFVDIHYKVSNETDTKKKFVFKFLPKANHLRNFMAQGELDKREVNFYKYASLTTFRNVLDKSGIPYPIPSVFYSVKDDNDLTIVMENLATYGYKTIIIRDGSTLQQTIVALESLAVIHAAGILSIKNNEPDFGIKTAYNNDFYDEFFIPNLKTLSEIFQDTELSQIFLDMIPHTKILRTHKYDHCFIHTIIHGDMWAGQCLFSEDEKSACALDWQFCEFGNPSSDIVSMFFMSTDPEVLENHFESILKAYWSKFTKTLDEFGHKTSFKYEEFVENVEKNLLTGFIYITVSLHDFQGSDNISDKRLKGLIYFLQKRKVFQDIMKQIQSKSI